MRFRIIDAKIKEEKIKNSPLIKFLNPGNLAAIEQKEENTKNDDFMGMMKDIGVREVS